MLICKVMNSFTIYNSIILTILISLQVILKIFYHLLLYGNMAGLMLS